MWFLSFSFPIQLLVSATLVRIFSWLCSQSTAGGDDTFGTLDLLAQIQVFGGLLGETVQSIHACGEDIDILNSFEYLGSIIHNNGGLHQEVLWWIGMAHGVMDLLKKNIWRCQYLCKQTKIQIFKLLVISFLLHGCETSTLNTDLKRWIDVLGNKCLHRMMGYCWNDCVKSAISPWNWIKAYYQHSPPTSTPAIWACGTLPRSRSCFSGCLWNG